MDGFQNEHTIDKLAIITNKSSLILMHSENNSKSQNV